MGGMPLTDFQRKNPNRPIGGRNHQSYLERSFELGARDDMEHWWTSGAVHGVLAAAVDNTYRAHAFMQAAINGMNRGWPPAEIARWWPRLWEAGAARLVERHAGWLYALAAEPQSCRFLLAQGASPHVPVAAPQEYPHKDPVSACVSVLHQVLKRSTDTFRPASREWVNDLWSHMAFLWAQPGWEAPQQVVALGLLTRMALWAEPHHPDQARWEALRDGLLRDCPDRWGGAGTETGLLYHWIDGMPTPLRRGESLDPDRLARWQAWGDALLHSPPPFPPPIRLVSNELLGADQMPPLGPFVARMAAWGLACWDVYVPPRSFTSQQPSTLMDVLVSSPETGLTTDLSDGWWAGLVEAGQRLGPPPEQWQASALEAWLKATLNQQPPSHTEVGVDRCPPGLRTTEQQADWVARWVQWSAIGGWAEHGVPPAVIGLFRSSGGQLADLPAPLLQHLVPHWQRWGFLPKGLGDPLDGGGGADPWNLDALTCFKASPSWRLWQRLCSDGALRSEALAILRDDPDRLLAAACLGRTAALGPPATADDLTWAGFISAACAATPLWLSQRGGLVLEAALQRDNGAVAALLVDLGAPLPQDWKSWHMGFLCGAADRPKRLQSSCPRLALAHRLNQAGLAWEAGPDLHRPLSVVVGHWDPGVGDHAAKGLLEAGADPDGAVRRQTPVEEDHDGTPEEDDDGPTPNRACWAAAVLAKRLTGVVAGAAGRIRPRM